MTAATTEGATRWWVPPGPTATARSPWPGDLFAPALYEDVRRPIGLASNLPNWCYTSPAFFERELERIFMKVWNFVGRVERVANEGDYFAVDVARVPVLVARARDGEVRAFSNTCRHRGCLVARGEGNARGFVCPYHAWTYALSGDLVSAPTEMDASAGFDTKDYGLHRIRLESWGGFMFVCFDPDAAPLADHLGNLPEILARYACDDLVLARRIEYDVPCNWKFYVENLKDAQHVATVHRSSISQYASPRKYWRAVQETTGNVVSTFMSYPGSAALLKGDTGFPMMRSLDEATAGTTAPLVLPGTYISCTTDCAWYVHVDPVAVDRIRLEQGALFPRETMARPDFAAMAAPYFRRFDLTQAEDNEVCALQHRGLSSPYASPGRYAVKEELVHRIQNWILDRVLDQPRG
ncbi:MAG: aromatic ring-hydroxylating dioxygenase subunit alpha [Alphaproteobacteria bacterium]|nr:aromatic ring-hydroxylating dioxygenase subunit alpha [Alphaproteobacteria bacterium]